MTIKLSEIQFTMNDADEVTFMDRIIYRDKNLEIEIFLGEDSKSVTWLLKDDIIKLRDFLNNLPL